MNKVHKERLLKVANFLEKIPNKHFNLEFFTNDNDIDHGYDSDYGYDRNDEEDKILLVKLNKIAKDLKKHRCGAVACAVGWMPAIFPRTFKWDMTASTVLRKHTGDFPLSGFFVIERFLGLKSIQADLLFANDYYPKGRRGPKSVANKIKKFVETGNLPKILYNN